MSSEEFINRQIVKIKEELQENPNDHSLLHDLGVGYYLLGEYEKAVDNLKMAVNLSEKNPTYFFNLANACAALENYSMAKKYYLDALDAEPAHIPSLTNLADSYEASGDIKKAQEIFTYITRLAPQNALAFFNLGNFLMRQNQHIEAVKNYEQAIQLEESFVDAYHNITWVLTEVKAYDEAFVYAKKGLKIDPAHNELKELLRKILDKRG